MSIEDITVEVTREYYESMVKAAIMGLHIFGKIKLDDIRDMMNEYIRYHLQPVLEPEEW